MLTTNKSTPFPVPDFTNREEQTLIQIAECRNTIISEMEKCVIGQKEVIELLLIALLAEGHCILHGLPGLGKTLIIKTLSQILDVSFNRIQFTPDLMPADIIGSEIIEEDDKGHKSFRFIEGPIFSNLLLADEINRTPPKTQSALLQVMQEKAVTVFGKTHILEYPFFVLATENPIEQEGIYSLPEAQLDRFLFSIDITYPSVEEEVVIASKKTFFDNQPVNKIINSKQLWEYQHFIENIPISEKMIEYAVNIIKETRPQSTHLGVVKEHVSYGAGVRASQSVVIASKAHAALNGNMGVTKENIQKVILPILRHRIILNYSAYAENIDVQDIISEIINQMDK